MVAAVQVEATSSALVMRLAITVTAPVIAQRCHNSARAPKLKRAARAAVAVVAIPTARRCRQHACPASLWSTASRPPMRLASLMPTAQPRAVRLLTAHRHHHLHRHRRHRRPHRRPHHPRLRTARSTCLRRHHRQHHRHHLHSRRRPHYPLRRAWTHPRRRRPRRRPHRRAAESLPL